MANYIINQVVLYFPYIKYTKDMYRIIYKNNLN